MSTLGILLMFGGYTLVYAGMAHHGVFASNPWAALFTDAYPANQPPAVGSQGGGA